MSDDFNPYGGQGGNLEAETNPLDAVIQTAVKAILMDVHTMIPAKITRIRPNGFVDIQPSIQRRYINGEKAVNLPQIQNCPVGYLRGADYVIKPPYAVGDAGMAFFSERSLDKWGVAGGDVDPQDERTHDLNDAVFVPGLFSAKDALKNVDPAVLLLRNGSAEVHLKKAGTFRFANTKIPDELMQILDDMLSVLESIAGVAGLNPVVFSPAYISALNAVQARIVALKG